MYYNYVTCNITCNIIFYDVECLDIVHIEAETVWASIGLKNQRKLIVGAFYQPPDNLIKPMNDFVILDVILKIKNNPNCTVIFASDMLVLLIGILIQYMNTLKVNKLTSELQI